MPAVGPLPCEERRPAVPRGGECSQEIVGGHQVLELRQDREEMPAANMELADQVAHLDPPIESQGSQAEVGEVIEFLGAAWVERGPDRGKEAGATKTGEGAIDACPSAQPDQTFDDVFMHEGEPSDEDQSA